LGRANNGEVVCVASRRWTRHVIRNVVVAELRSVHSTA